MNFAFDLDKRANSAVMEINCYVCLLLKGKGFLEPFVLLACLKAFFGNKKLFMPNLKG